VFFLSSEKHGLFPENNFQSDEVIYYGLLGTSTNHVWYRHFPSGEFDFHLFDKSGNEVSKRKAGSALTVTPAKASKHDLMFWRTSHLNPYNVDNHGGEYHSLFRPDDIFIITNSGTYALVIQMRLCLIMTNGLPDLSAMVDARTVTEHNPDKFGVFTSPQLRVKVVKGDFPKPD